MAFLPGHLGFPFPSPTLFKQLGGRFRRAVASFAETNRIPWITFTKDEAKLDVMTPYLARQAATRRSGVAAIGVEQDFQRVWTAHEGKTSTGTPRWSFVKADRRVTCYYLYLWDADFGLAFIKVCAYFPYPGKIWINGHEWAKRQATKAGLGFTELSNGFATCTDPAALQEICDRLTSGTVNVSSSGGCTGCYFRSARKTMMRATGGKTSMRRIEISRTLVFDAPKHARGFFKALVADNLDFGPPHRDSRQRAP
ncbi:hypothetical protein [Nonomuraea polychroma]|uniref:hypothetical protein n=1 Tax=Nonomuraea polychroma TaxID=46176 RepID=UPI0019D4A44B|nr:hypothetical protein [Nonomuraea polychroma]